MVELKTRFAPSPTGYLHLGHAYSAAQAFRFAQQHGGECLLRLEDTDQTRCRLEYEKAILEDLQWLGFSWTQPVRRQSEHMQDYEKVLHFLRSHGLVYRCFKTRKEILDEIALAPHDTDILLSTQETAYIGTPLSLDEETMQMKSGKAYAWRLSMVAARKFLGDQWHELAFQEMNSGPHGESGIIRVRPEIFGDVILARKDTGTSYHLACVHDDALQGITQIIRGQDLFAVTHLHVLLQRLLGYNTPIYRHHRLLTDEQGKRFAKRDNAKTLRSMRKEGLLPKDVFAMIGDN